MKIQNLLLVPTLLALWSAQAEARKETYDHNGQSFEVVFQGHSVKVAPSLAVAHPTAAGGTAPDCAYIHSELQKRQWMMDACAGENPPESVCRMLVSGLRLMAEGRADTQIPIDRGAVQIWQIGAPDTGGIDGGGLRAGVAARFHVPVQSVELVATGIRPRITSTPLYVTAQDSESRKVEKFVRFAPEDLASFTNDGRLVTRNKIFACDLAEGKSFLQANSTSLLRSVDHVPDEVVDTAWAAYRAVEAAGAEIDAETSPFAKGALIGFRLGLAVASQPASGDPLLQPGALFRRLYATDSGAPRLLPRGTRDELRERTYPDVTLEDSLVQSWRIQ